jgi:hypothetical protein
MSLIMAAEKCNSEKLIHNRTGCQLASKVFSTSKKTAAVHIVTEI